MYKLLVLLSVLIISFFVVQKSWVNASKKQREKLLELIRRLAEDDKEGVMAYKVRIICYSIFLNNLFALFYC